MNDSHRVLISHIFSLSKPPSLNGLKLFQFCNGLYLVEIKLHVLWRIKNLPSHLEQRQKRILKGETQQKKVFNPDKLH